MKTGGDTWFFLTADYAFGYALEKDTSDIVTANGGKVLGSVRVPLNSSDFSSFLLQAQSSKAKIVALANAGRDTTNSIKQAAEFGTVKQGQKLAGLLMTLTEVHSLGLDAAQGLVLTEGFYWDHDDQSRAFSERSRPGASLDGTPDGAALLIAVARSLRSGAFGLIGIDRMCQKNAGATQANEHGS